MHKVLPEIPGEDSKLIDELRWLLGFRKLRSSKKDEILQVVLFLRVAS